MWVLFLTTVPFNIGEVRLKLEQVTSGSDRGTPGLRGVSLEVQSGEILGIAGVSGNGQRELAESITGLRKVTGGKIYLEGEDITGMAPGDITERMLSYIPEERMRDGMIQEFHHRRKLDPARTSENALLPLWLSQST